MSCRIFIFSASQSFWVSRNTFNWSSVNFPSAGGFHCAPAELTSNKMTSIAVICFVAISLLIVLPMRFQQSPNGVRRQEIRGRVASASSLRYSYQYLEETDGHRSLAKEAAGDRPGSCPEIL